MQGWAKNDDVQVARDFLLTGAESKGEKRGLVGCLGRSEKGNNFAKGRKRVELSDEGAWEEERCAPMEI